MRMQNEKTVLLEAIKAAGKAIVEMQTTGFSIATKNNNEIVTKADLLANEILKTALLENFPTDGWLSEESVDDERRLLASRVWIVDPIDGTKEFATLIPEYAISVALVQNHEPIMAAVYNPAVEELYFAEAGKGASLNGTPIRCQVGQRDKLSLLASRSEFARGEWNRFVPDNDVIQMGSIAYKLALVAAGKGNATFSLGPKNEWDIAAGCLLVREAGGFANDKEQNQFKFNRRQVKVNGIVAGHAQLMPTIYQMIV